ncbi:molecular chaperone [Shewanella xiamenensis]|uniref:fimbrial biogenesis chaperone n=1 Tax=Shewanella xiamenensis TaxID=332186 RepID=UPI0035BB12C1
MIKKITEKNNIRKFLVYTVSSFLSMLFVITPTSITAGVLAENTRIIYNLDNREQSLQIFNVNDYPVLVQLWVDDGEVEGSPEKALESPILPLPAIFKLKKKESKSIRLVNVSTDLAKDRETLYWFNIYEVPPEPNNEANIDEKNVLILTTRTQMKLLLRPAELFKQVIDMPSKTSFKWESNALILINDSPFYVTIFSLKSSEQDEHSHYNGMLAPYSKTTLAWKLDAKPESLIMTYLDDNGSQNDYTLKLSK